MPEANAVSYHAQHRGGEDNQKKWLILSSRKNLPEICQQTWCQRNLNYLMAASHRSKNKAILSGKRKQGLWRPPRQPFHIDLSDAILSKTMERTVQNSVPKVTAQYMHFSCWVTSAVCDSCTAAQVPQGTQASRWSNQHSYCSLVVGRCLLVRGHA